MADARALLRAKRQEARVNHPLAAYSASGQLRCVACGTGVKMASSWEGHVGSKAHRTNVARLREEERRREEEERRREEEERRAMKRKTEELEEGADEEGAGRKRQRLEDREDEDTDADEDEDEDEGNAADGHVARATSTHANANALPADFFSDPSQVPQPRSGDPEDEAEAEAGDEDGKQGPAARAPTTAAQPASAIDLEWLQFQEAVVNAPDVREAFARATVAAEPVLVEGAPAGFPPAAGPAGEGAEGAEGKADEADEAEVRRRREREDRELIMDRLVEEERAQEDADARVVQLKSRLEALRKQREARREARRAAKAGAA